MPPAPDAPADRPFWIFLLTAVAGEGCTFPAGERHAILAAAVGADEAEAGRRVEAALAGNGWARHELSRSGLVAGVEDAREARLRRVAEAAVRDGCALLAYDEAIG